jgi:glycosyltransferase involved in cell wall biosynthesis
VLLLHNNSRLGRGSSLNRAIEASSGEYVIYMDVDLATDINYTKLLVEHLEDGASIAIGSRLMKGSNVSRPLTRDIASKSYNILVRFLFRSKIQDHQCGFKALNKKDAINIIHMVKDNHWFWDTELLVIAQKMGYRIDEIPVEWKHNGGNNLNASKVRVIKDSIYMGKRLINLKLRLITLGFQYKRDTGFGTTLNGKLRR